MTDKAPRNLVVCCDGTSNEIGKLLSNVLKLYRIAEKSERQITFYQPGIGTIAMPDDWGRWRQRWRSIFEMGTGAGLDRDVLGAYTFLARNYRPGDRIFLFGFSRGAYTVRVVAGMIYLIGLLRAHQVNFAGYAWKAYKTAKESDDYQAAREFRDIVLPDCVPVHFVGVWDTVSSVIVPGRLPFSELRLEELPFTSENPAVQVFRHAMAIDEFRRMFRVKAWAANQVFKPNPHSQAKPVDQDTRQVWFAGCHSDVGGGFVEDQSALSKFPLLWMLEQAKAQGLILRTAMINHIVRGQPLAGARDYQKPDPAGQLHSSMQWYWKIAELWPKRVRASDWPNRKGWIGYYLPLGEPRYIEPESLIHISVIERMRDTLEYHPKNLPDIRTEESLTGPNTVKGKPSSSARRA